MSRGFISALGGIALTLLAWYAPFLWPAWPAFAAIDLIFGKSGFADLSYAQRAAAITLLIVINVGFWAVVIRALLEVLSRSGGAVHRG